MWHLNKINPKEVFGIILMVTGILLTPPAWLVYRWQALGPMLLTIVGAVIFYRARTAKRKQAVSKPQENLHDYDLALPPDIPHGAREYISGSRDAHEGSAFFGDGLDG